MVGDVFFFFENVALPDRDYWVSGSITDDTGSIIDDHLLIVGLGRRGGANNNPSIYVTTLF